MIELNTGCRCCVYQFKKQRFGCGCTFAMLVVIWQEDVDGRFCWTVEMNSQSVVHVASLSWASCCVVGFLPSAHDTYLEDPARAWGVSAVDPGI